MIACTYTCTLTLILLMSSGDGPGVGVATGNPLLTGSPGVYLQKFLEKCVHFLKMKLVITY